MLLRCLAALVAFTLMVTGATAGDQSHLNATDGSNPILQYGVGTESCGAFLSAVYGLAPGAHIQLQQDGRVFNDRSQVLMQWVMGFVTAVNVVRAYESPPRPRQLDTDEAAVAAWLQKRCADNPTETVVVALTRLVIELGQSE